MRKTSKPSITLKQDLENMDAFASNGGKGNGGRELLRDSGIEVSSIEYSQQHGISQISSKDMFLVPCLLVHPSETSRKIRENLD